MKARAAFAAMLSLAACLAGGATPLAAQTAGPAYLIVALPSRRVVTQARPDVLAARIAPGSVIKIATLIAAMEQGVVDDSTRIACRRTVTVDGRILTCVHPDVHRPLAASEALGYSCNTFFAAVAQRISRSALDDVLLRMGLAPSGGGSPTALVALGLAGVGATARGLLDAFIKVTGPASVFRMSDRTRATVMSGLRMAAATGTASAFGEAGMTALAKTGTAQTAGGTYHGVVVATFPDPTPAYAIVVVVPGGAGSDAAAAAVEAVKAAGIARRGVEPVGVRVGIAGRGGGYDRVSLSLEDYVARVVSGETSPGAPAAALEALAITVRTFAAANRGRHAAEGFDLCDLTHCQVIGRATPTTVRAARSTAGLVLRDKGQVAHVFYSAACGGHTESPSHVWAGAPDPAYLPSQPDPLCLNDAGWTSALSEPKLRLALESAGLRGSVVRGFRVASRDPSGRVASLSVDGMVPDAIDAETFRLAAGRVLGWQAVKSTLFDVRRSGAGFVLAGRGFGHGVGLCVRGAATRALQGQTRDRILSAYFPGLTVGAPLEADRQRRGGTPTSTDTAIRVLLPEADREHLADVRELARQLSQTLSSSLGMAAPSALELRFYPTVEAYSRETGLPWWTSATTIGSRIELLPIDVLQKRGILELTLRHELVHVLADPVLRDRPLWVREGLAVVKAGEGSTPGNGRPTAGPSTARIAARDGACPADADFVAASSPDQSRAVYDAAGRCVARALAAGTAWRNLR
jgi:SpoIID/LytB domain protein